MIQQSHSQAYIWTKLSLIKIDAPLCPLQHQSQQPRHGNNLNVHQQILDQEDVVHIFDGILLSHKKNKTMPFSPTWMELWTLILSEISQKEKDKYHMISLIIGIFFFLLLLLFCCCCCYFLGRSRGIWRFPGQGLNRSCSHWPTPEHSSAGSEPHLQPTPQLTATPDR